MRFPAAGPWRDMFATNPPFREVWCTYRLQMTGIDALLYGPTQDDEGMSADDNYEDLWTPRMEAGFRLASYQRSKRKQKSRHYCESGFTLGAMVDVVAKMFEVDAKAEWVVLESVRQEDGHVMQPS